MAWNDLSDPSAVEKAMRECDRLGRRAFLQHYGYREARDYFVRHRGQLYDSKAIVGVAHQYEFPDRGPLVSSEFSGGAATVAKKLRDLGFELTTKLRTDTNRWYWAFCANPSRYRIREAVSHLELDRWTVGRSQPRSGDLCIVWQTQDRSGKRGIVALGKILTDPTVESDSSNPYWVDSADASVEYARVAVRYQVPNGLPLWINEARAGTLLKNLKVAKAQGGTIFRLTESEWSALQGIVPCDFPSIEESEITEFSRFRTRSLSGQGFGLSADQRRAVELRAMHLARSHYGKRGYEVIDVSSNCSFDLLCRRTDDEIRVEVKGTTGDGSKVVLTKNEVKESSSGKYAVFVVSEIALDEAADGKPVASGGHCHRYEPFDQSAHELQPLNYVCSLDLDLAVKV